MMQDPQEVLAETREVAHEAAEVMAEPMEQVLQKVYGWGDQLIALLPNLLVALLVLLLFWLIGRGMRKVARSAVLRMSHNEALSRLAGTVAAFVVMVVGLFIALGLLQLEKTVTSLLAGAGVLGLALGFAFQDITANFLAGVTISLRKPFSNGDLIESNDYTGIVDEITLRTTRLHTGQGQTVLIPNKSVFENPIVNYTSSGRRRLDLECGVSYDDDLDKAREVALKAVEHLEGREEGSPTDFFYTEFGGSSIDFLLRIWLADTSQRTYKEVRGRAIEALKVAFDEADISIPFPIRTLDFGIRGGEPLSAMLRDGGSDG